MLNVDTAKDRRERRDRERFGWRRIENWERFTLAPDEYVSECAPSRDGQAIFYRTSKR